MVDNSSMSKTTNNNMRDSEGKYRHSFEKMCVCGHENGDHTAERVKVTNPDGTSRWLQDCLADGCDCLCFAKVRKPRKPRKG